MDRVPFGSRQLFLDMDGVLADFDGQHERVFGYRTIRDGVKTLKPDWDGIGKMPHFWDTIPPMPDMDLLWDYFSGYNPKVLTGIPHMEDARAKKQKVNWIRENVDPNVEVICILSRTKYLFCKPGDVLIDDWTKYRDLWVKAGGVWITHTSALDSILKFNEVFE